MIAKWSTICGKCDIRIGVGTEIKAHYKRVGLNPETHKPIWERVPKSYVHAPKCPKVTPNRPGQRKVDPETGEIFSAVAESSPIPRHFQERLL